MSHDAYNLEWKEAQQYLEEILASEPDEKLKPVKDRNLAFSIVAKLFIRYIQLLLHVERCFDQTVHPQKRLLLRRIVDGVLGRILEIKQEMVNLELSDFHYFDDILADMKLSPVDVVVPIPKYFVVDAEKVIRDRHAFISSIRTQLEVGIAPIAEPMPIKTAVLIIQRHERARQGRLRAKYMREIRAQEEAEINPIRFKRDLPNPKDAAIKIQKAWRGYLARQYTRRMRQDEFIWLGMEPMDLHYNTTISNPKKMAKRIESLRRVAQGMNSNEYEQALIKLKEKIRQTEGIDMQERMEEQIRQWFLECRDANGVFPDYPPPEEAGSLWLFKEKPPELLAQEEAERLAAEQKKKEKEKGKGGAKAEQKKAKEPEGWVMGESRFLEDLVIGAKEYSDNWKHREEGDNFFQRHDEEIIKADKRVELDLEIRAHVDDLMRQELRNLKIAIDGDKQKRINKKRVKKPKGKRGKGKKMKDMTKDKTLESVYEELVMESVIKKPARIPLEQYFGEYSYLGTTLRNTMIEPQPSLADVKQLITLYGIIPLGAPDVHERGPLIRSIMLAGPWGTGKKMLVQAICTETGANLFDLTATNIMGKYVGKQATRLLVNMVFKVARLLQPSVIVVDECEKMFGRKIPKTDKTEPKRLKSELPKAMRTVKADDRILLVGCTNAPYDAKVKPFCKLYDRIIMIPRPDYASRYLIWKVLIVRNGGVLTEALDISSLAKVSDGYTMGMMNQACKDVLSERRLAQLDKIPLVASEFIVPLSHIDPVFGEEEDAFKAWYRKTPIGRKRLAAIKEAAEAASKSSKSKR